MGISELKEMLIENKTCITDKNKELMGKCTNGKLDTKENMSILLSYYVLEDFDMIVKLIEDNVKERYIYDIVRMLCESIIEYKYYMKNDSLIGEYFGSEISELDEENYDIDFYKKLGQDRLKSFNGRKNVRDMAKDIDEDYHVDVNDNKDNKLLSLYYIYSFTSEKVHNCFFNEILNDIATFDGEKCGLDEEFLSMLLTTLLVKFNETYFNN